MNPDSFDPNAPTLPESDPGAETFASNSDSSTTKLRAGEGAEWAGAAADYAISDRYALERVHASGGLGQVWVARDLSLDRKVAFKEILPQWRDKPSVHARFLREAQITGRLEHPGIVPVYELSRGPGCSSPFYTMKLVRGSTLSESIQKYQELLRNGKPTVLELQTLLNALVSVANAIAYAHSKGVIHRDLKGENIMIGDFGEVMVLDWGIAKILNQSESVVAPLQDQFDAPEMTNAGQVIGTPAFMAPEQAQGRIQDIGPHTDVYGLGALLYEILTGGPPFRGRTTAEVLSRVVQETPTPPRSLQSKIPEPLQAICLKALQKEAACRYPSAAAFADDIRRYLADEPVSVWEEPWLKQAARWSRRHRAWVASGAAILAASVLGLSIGTVMLRRKQSEIERQRIRAEQNFALAKQAVDQYLTRVADSPELKAQGLELLRRQLFGAAKGFYEQFAQQRSNDPAAHSDLALANSALARINHAMGQDADAEKLYLSAAAVFERLAREQPRELNHRVRLCEALGNLAQHYATVGQVKLAETYFDRGAGLESLFSGAEIHAPELIRALAAIHDNRGTLLMKARRFAEAEVSHKKGLTLRVRAADLFPQDDLNQSGLIDCHVNLITLFARSGRLEETRPHVTGALAISEKLANAHPDQPLLQHKLGTALNNVGGVCVLDGRPQDARRAYERALGIRERLAQRHPSIREYQLALASSLINWGELASRSSQYRDAVAALDRALATLQGILALEGKNPSAKFYSAYAHSWRARSLEGEGRVAEAAESWSHALSFNDPNDPGIRAGWCLFQARQGRDPEKVITRIAEFAAAANLPPEVVLESAEACLRVAVETEKTDQSAALSVKARGLLTQLMQRLVSAGYFNQPVNVAAVRNNRVLGHLVEELNITRKPDPRP